MTLAQLKELVDKKFKDYPRNAEVILDGNKLDTVVDMWLLANGKVGIIGNSTIEMFAKIEDY